MTGFTCFKLTALVCGLVVNASALSAQPPPSDECGNYCRTCHPDVGEPENGHKGYSKHHDGIYDLGCYANIPNCLVCSHVVKDGSPQSEMIVRAVESATPPDVPSVVDRFRDRLRLDQARGLVMVMGPPCNPGAVDAVIFVAAEVSTAYLNLGVRPFEASTGSISALARTGVVPE